MVLASAPSLLPCMLSVSHERVCFWIRSVTSVFFFDMVSSHVIASRASCCRHFSRGVESTLLARGTLDSLDALCLHERFIFLLGLVLFGFRVFTVGYVWTKRYFGTNNGKSDPAGKGAACLLRFLVYLSPLSLWWLNLSLGLNRLNFDLLSHLLTFPAFR